MQKQKSFTVIELLVVIAIIGLISSIILVSLKEAREKARIAGGLEFSQSIQHALGAYAVGIWKFEETDDTALDSSGYQNHGTIYDATSTEGILGSALSFDGVDDYVEVPDNATLDITGDITIEAWIKPAVAFGSMLGDWPIILYKTTSDDNNRSYGVFIDKANGALLWTFRKDGIYYTVWSVGITFNAGRWYHLVFTYDKNTSSPQMKMYIDGVLNNQAEVTVPIPITDQPLYIGVSSPGWNHFQGLIDEVRIYDQALNVAQIQRNYVQESKKYGKEKI